MTRPTLYLLDTNICIYTMKNSPPQVGQQLLVATQAGHSVGISSITAHELWYGVRRSTQVESNRVKLEKLVALLDLYDFNDAAAQRSGEIRASLQAAGTPIGPYDVLIAGHAQSLGAVLVTNNTREFRRVEGLKVEDWTV